MHLKIYCDRWDDFTKEILYKIHECGYRMEIIIFYGNKPENDNFLSFYSQRLTGNFIQLFICHPSRLGKNFSASKNIALIPPSCCDFLEKDIESLKLMDYIFVSQNYLKNKLMNNGIEDGKIISKLYICDKKNIEKSETKKFTFLFHAPWNETSGWQELLFSYCKNIYKKTDLIISVNEDLDKVNSEIDNFFNINEFDRKKYLGLYIINGKNFVEAARLSDCFVLPYRFNYYDQNLILAMHAGIPVIINNVEYYDFCKKNSCWIPNSLSNGQVDIFSLEEIMFKIISDKKEVKRKSEYARKFINNIYVQENFAKSMEDIFDKFDIDKIPNVSLKISKYGNIL